MPIRRLFHDHLRPGHLTVAAALAACPLPAQAAELSTHILDLARGVGGAGVPVTLMRRGTNGGWQEAARARTDADGRVRSFGDPARFPPGTYKLHFDLSAYPAAGATPFFPEIDVTFRVSDAAHYHVPVVVSPFGYSTYRGN